MFSWVLNALRVLQWLTPCVEDIKANLSCLIAVILKKVSEYEKLVDDVADEGHRP